LGQGGLDPITGETLEGLTPHASIDGGCVGCHAGDQTRFERGGNHDFSVNYAMCKQCHEAGRVGPNGNVIPTLHDPRAQARPPKSQSDRLAVLLERAARTEQLGDTRLPSAIHSSIPKQLPTTSPALHNLLLISSDPAAYAHNPSYFGLLLDRSSQN
jgi:hypothetical protein